jgi:hypothetical protein
MSAAFEYRVCWNADSNISFEGSTEWCEHGGFEESAEDVERSLSEVTGTTNIPQALDEALEASGFGYWVEVRVMGDDEAVISRG